MDELPEFTPVPAPDESRQEAFEQFYKEAVRARRMEDPSEWGYLQRSEVTIGWQALGIVTAPALCTALGVWLGSRNGRKVRIKIGDIEAEAQTEEQVNKLIARAQEIQKKIQQRNQQPPKKSKKAISSHVPKKKSSNATNPRR